MALTIALNRSGPKSLSKNNKSNADCKLAGLIRTPMKNSIKDWPLQERPRERLLNQGGKALSDAELLAILLRSGYAEHSAISLARQLMLHFGSLGQVLDAPAEELLKFKGIGASKYAILLASKVLCQRYLQQQLRQQPALQHSSLVLDYLRLQLQDQAQEVFAVLLLDLKGHFLDFKILFQGSVTACHVSTREIVSFALQKQAPRLIVVHNHPQATAQPSAADIAFTHKLFAACRLLDLQLLDHFIIASNDYFSFTEQGILAEAET